jgi:hypothetical protein
MKSRIRSRVSVTAMAMLALWAQSFQGAAAQAPDENRRQVVEALGSPFLVFRDKVLEELKVNDEQRDKLMQHILEQIMETGPFLDSLRDAGPEGEKKLNEHRKSALEKLAKVVKDVLQPEQLSRLRQLTLQRDGGFALLQNDVQKDLEISPEQKKKFMALMKELQENIQLMIKAAQSGGKPEELGPKVEQLRKDQGKKLEAALTDAQKKQWQELLGPPFELGD